MTTSGATPAGSWISRPGSWRRCPRRRRAMRVVSEQQLEETLRALPAPEPRVVASGNLATPRALLDSLERALERYRLFMLAAQAPLPAARRGDPRDAVRRARDARRRRAAGLPADAPVARPEAVRDDPPARRRAAAYLDSAPGKVSLGIEVNILPAAVEAVRARGGLVVAQLNPRMPYTLGDSELEEDLIDLAIEVEEELPSPTARSVARARRADRRARREPRRGRLHAAARDRPGPRRHAARAVAQARARDLVGDDQRWRDGARARWALDSAASDRVLVPVRLARALRVGRSEPEAADDPHGDHERPVAHRRAAGDGLRQHRAAGRSLRSGRSQPHKRPPVLGLRRPARLRRGRPALTGRSRGHRAALLARAQRHLHDRPPPD